MVLARNSDPAVVDVVLKPFAQIGNKAVSHFLGKRTELRGDGRGLGPAREKLAHDSMSRRPMLKADPNVTQTGVCRKLPKLSSCIQGKTQAGGNQGLGPEESPNAIPVHDVEGLPVEWPPHIEGKPSARRKNPAHLPHGGGAI